MKNKLAIFDLDGTLIDTCKANYYSYKEACNESGYRFDITEDEFKNLFWGKNYRVFLPKIINEQDEKILTLIHKRKTIRYPVNLELYSKKNEKLFNNLWILKQDHYLVLLTTAAKINAQSVLDFYGFEKIFDLIITAEDVKCLKPATEGYLKAMKYFGVTADNTKLYDDSVENINAAAQIGISVFCVDAF